MILNKACIFDIDGTVSDDSNRVDLANDKNIDLYNAYARYDKAFPWCVEIIRLFKQDGYTIFFVTGRPDSMREETTRWINANLTFLDNEYALIMKTDADPENTVEFKKHRYLTQIAPTYEVLFVLEDRALLANAWRSLGLTCLQCADRI